MHPFWRTKRPQVIGDKTLVIVDTQTGFPGAYEVEETVIQLVCHAMKNRWPVILVEYDTCGFTIESITDKLEGYSCCSTVVKNGGDGGPYVIDCLSQHTSWPTNLVVCGVYGDCCVSDTVSGLFENSSLVEVDVVIDAIYPEYKSRDGYANGEREVTLDEIMADNKVWA